MLRSWKFWVALGGIVAVVALLGFGLTQNPREVKSPLVGKQAPPFRVEQLRGEGTVSTESLRGTPFVLNFWASWCAACRDEAPMLEAAYERYDEQQGRLRVIGIAVQDTPEKATRFAERFGKRYFLALDNEAGDISLSYGLYGVPETFFVDHEGIIRYKQIGALTEEVLHEQIRRLIALKEEESQP